MAKSPSAKRRKDVADRLHAFIKRCGGRTAFMNQTGIPLSTISAWFGKAKGAPHGEQLLALWQRGLNLNWLIAGDEPMLREDLRLPEDQVGAVRGRVVNELRAEFGSGFEAVVERVVPPAAEFLEELLDYYRPWIERAGPLMFTIDGVKQLRRGGEWTKVGVDLRLGEGPIP